MQTRPKRLYKLWTDSLQSLRSVAVLSWPWSVGLIEKDPWKVQARVHSGSITRFGRAINYLALIKCRCSWRKMKTHLKEFFLAFKKEKIPPPVGLEPTTFELEVQHASPLRHGAFMCMVESILLTRILLHSFSFSPKFLPVVGCWNVNIKELSHLLSNHRSLRTVLLFFSGFESLMITASSIWKALTRHADHAETTV